MIGRVLGALLVVVCIGVSSTWPLEEQARRDGPAATAAPAMAEDESNRQYAGIEPPMRAKVQQAVNRAFTEVLPGKAVAFALDSAQSSRVEGGGRRFDGTGIATWDQADARFVSFTMTLSATGELVEFDYSTPLDALPEQALAVAEAN